MNKHIKRQLTSSISTDDDVVKTRNLVGNGIGIGAAAATVLLGGGYLIYQLASRKRRVLKTAETVEISFNAGLEVGKRQERDLREYLEEKGRTGSSNHSTQHCLT